MIDDIVKRLRALSRMKHSDFTIGDEAADIIEHLRNDIHSCGPTCSRAGCVNGRLRSALNAFLTHMGMDEDEFTKPTFDQARAALESTK